MPHPGHQEKPIALSGQSEKCSCSTFIKNRSTREVSHTRSSKCFLSIEIIARK